MTCVLFCSICLFLSFLLVLSLALQKPCLKTFSQDEAGLYLSSFLCFFFCLCLCSWTPFSFLCCLSCSLCLCFSLFLFDLSYFYFLLFSCLFILFLLFFFFLWPSLSLSLSQCSFHFSAFLSSFFVLFLFLSFFHSFVFHSFSCLFFCVRAFPFLCAVRFFFCASSSSYTKVMFQKPCCCEVVFFVFGRYASGNTIKIGVWWPRNAHHERRPHTIPTPNLKTRTKPQG